MYFTKDNISEQLLKFKTYKKKTLTKMARINGPFKVKTREGEMICENGFLALDSNGWPYPIHVEEQQKIYEEVIKC